MRTLKETTVIDVLIWDRRQRLDVVNAALLAYQNILARLLDTTVPEEH